MKKVDSVLVSEVKAHLKDKIIPFWMKLRDNEFGGYYGYMDYDLQLDQKASKGCILNSRIMWFFSNAYQALGEAGLLENATHAYEFMKKYCMDHTYGGVYWMLDYKGQPVEDMKHTYNQAFAIYALSSYYEASKNEEALTLAMDLFNRIETGCKDEYGYLEAFDRQWHLIDNRKLCDDPHMIAEGKVAQKTMNTILHVLEAYTELYRVSHKEEVAKCLKVILNMIEEKIYDPDKKQLDVFFDTKLNSIADMHSYGHDIEAAWLIDRGAEVLGDKELIEKIKKYTIEIAYKVKEVAFKEFISEKGIEVGALNNERFNQEIDETKIWWVQAETVVGFLNAYEKTGDKTFKEAALKEWAYIKEYLIDPREGSEWYWQLSAENKPNTAYPIVEPWKCPYHNGRMCLEVMRRKVDD